jgi:uncharacterized protein (TIGR03437 family)
MISEIRSQLSAHFLYRFAFAITMSFLVAGACGSIHAATLPTGFAETSITGLPSPTAMEFAPDGRLFVCLQGGQLRVIKNGVLLATPFLSLTVDGAGERGLLGVTFDPNFQSNNFVYVYYTVPIAPIHNRVSRFTANPANLDVALAGSELPILDLDNLSTATNHNGGAIHFGPDGKLYVAVGENANRANSQTLGNRLGKVLRINSDGTIPTDNPFFNTATDVKRSIWAMGLRNPFTFAFQPATGRMFINDVGENTWEEINDGIAGSNYGWGICEGFCAPGSPPFRDPLFEYAHGGTSTTGCAIAGGAFYNPATIQFPGSYVGQYFFADLCSGWIRVMNPANNTAAPFATGIANPVDLKVSSDGSLYYLAQGAGAVFRVQFAATQKPAVTLQPADLTVVQGQAATFQVTGSGTAPLTYQWQRNMVNISGATNPSYTIAATALADNAAKFRCVISNVFDSATSNEATLTVQALPPAILTEATTDVALAVDSVTWVRDPFRLLNSHNFSSDQRTRIMLFAINADLLNGENSSAMTAQLEDAAHMIYPLPVEFLGPVPNASGLTQVIIRLPDGLPANSDVLVSVTIHGMTSNKARFKIE